jgi:hypothetical protein
MATEQQEISVAPDVIVKPARHFGGVGRRLAALGIAALAFFGASTSTHDSPTTPGTLPANPTGTTENMSQPIKPSSSIALGEPAESTPNPNETLTVPKATSAHSPSQHIGSASESTVGPTTKPTPTSRVSLDTPEQASPNPSESIAH